MYGVPDGAVAENPIVVEDVPSVAISRAGEGEGTNLFYTSFSAVKDRYVPYFLAELDDELLKEFKAAVRLLGDCGLGGDVTRGFGLFSPRFEEGWPLKDIGENGWVVLSLYRPAEEEIERASSSGSRYRIVEKGGWVWGSDVFKPRLAFFEEGSFFEFKPEGENYEGGEYTILGRPVSVRV